MSGRYRVLVVDDSDFQRAVTIKRLEGTEFEVVGEARGGAEAVALYGPLAPDVVLLDVVMADQNGLVTLREIMTVNPQARVLMLSSMGTEDVLRECAAAGAEGFVLKPVQKEQLVQALRSAVRPRQ